MAGALTSVGKENFRGFVNTIITHIADGNENEERLVQVMGGTILETESERLLREGIEQGIEKGIDQGQAHILTLFNILLSENRIEDLRRAAENEDYRNQLFAKFDIL